AVADRLELRRCPRCGTLARLLRRPRPRRLPLLRSSVERAGGRARRSRPAPTDFHPVRSGHPRGSPSPTVLADHDRSRPSRNRREPAVKSTPAIVVACALLSVGCFRLSDPFYAALPLRPHDPLGPDYSLIFFSFES